MSTITLVLEPSADGTLHLPLPEEMRRGKIEVTATLRFAGHESEAPLATADMIARRMAALSRIRALNPYREITDAVAWQRDIRRDRPLADRA